MNMLCSLIEEFPVLEHPETEGDELFLFNTDNTHFQTITWKTKRRGKTAYEDHPTILDIECGCLAHPFPVFVKRQELLDAGYTLSDETIERSVFENV